MPLNRPGYAWILAGLLAALPLRGQNAINLSCPSQAPLGNLVDCLVNLSLATGQSVDSLIFGVQVTPGATAPGLTQGQLSFASPISGGFATPGNSNNGISVLWASLNPAVSGQVSLGTVSFALPSTASVGQTYAVTISGASASVSNTLVSLTIGSPVTVTVGVAWLQSVSNNVGVAGQTVANVAITGHGTSFVQGTTVASFGPGVTVNSLTVNSPTSATASLTIAGNAAGGARDVSLITGSEVATLDGGFTIVGGPLLSVSKSHSGKFSQRQSGATYTVTVSNGYGAGPTNGTVTLAEMVPAGMSLTSMSGGATWSCSVPSASCTTGSVLNGGASYPAITVTVSVARDASTTLTNQVTVSMGGSVVASVGDPTTVISLCDVNQDTATTVTDAQKIVNQALGNASPANDVNNDGVVNIVDVQRVMNAVLGMTCMAS